MVIGYTEKKTAVAKYCSVTVQKCTHTKKLKIEEACEMVHIKTHQVLSEQNITL